MINSSVHTKPFLRKCIVKCFDESVASPNFKSFFLSQEKLFSSKNRTQASLGKKLKGDMLAEIEKVHKVCNTNC